MGTDEERALEEMRRAFTPQELISAFLSVGIDYEGIAKACGVEAVEVARWQQGGKPRRRQRYAMGSLRLALVHVLQRRGLSLELVARWLRNPDGELGFRSPLEVLGMGMLAQVLVAYDEHLSPRAASARLLPELVEV